MTTTRPLPPALERPTTSDVEYLAYHDSLTGLPNRAQLRERLAEALSWAAHSGEAVALLYVDLNDFKLVNDSLGHAAGDELLRVVARRLAAVVGRRDTIARQGGDEFLLLLAGLPTEGARERAELSAEAVAAALEQPFTIGEAVFQIGASVGIALYPEQAGDAETLHMHADAAMYRAKESGGGAAVYEPTATDPLAKLSLAARLRQALARDEFELHYQPIFSLLPEPAIRGVEALVRWRDPERGLVPPLDFIPVAEHTGVIDAIGAWVLNETCRQAREWQDEGLVPNFGINVSPRELRQPDFHTRMVGTIATYGLDPSRFVVELTESAWMLEASRALDMLQAISDAGPLLALDDFGAGYSSLARLRALPAHIIKIDRAFLDGLPDDPEACAIVAAIFQLAAACGCDVVAEGIETADQLQFLTERGCRLGQGYHLARPTTADEVTELLRDQLMADRRL